VSLEVAVSEVDFAHCAMVGASRSYLSGLAVELESETFFPDAYPLCLHSTLHVNSLRPAYTSFLAAAQ
jgi:hypothetical protein